MCHVAIALNRAVALTIYKFQFYLATNKEKTLHIANEKANFKLLSEKVSYCALNCC